MTIHRPLLALSLTLPLMLASAPAFAGGVGNLNTGRTISVVPKSNMPVAKTVVPTVTLQSGKPAYVQIRQMERSVHRLEVQTQKAKDNARMAD